MLSGHHFIPLVNNISLEVCPTCATQHTLGIDVCHSCACCTSNLLIIKRHHIFVVVCNYHRWRDIMARAPSNIDEVKHSAHVLLHALQKTPELLSDVFHECFASPSSHVFESLYPASDSVFPPPLRSEWVSTLSVGMPRDSK